MISSDLICQYDLSPYEAIYISAFDLGDTLKAEGKAAAFQDIVLIENFEPRMKEVLQNLPLRDSRILLKRASGLPLEKIGQEEGLSRERVRQIEVMALKRLRHPTRARHIQLPTALLGVSDENLLRALIKVFGQDTPVADIELALQILELSSRLEQIELKKLIATQMLKESCLAEEVQRLTIKITAEASCQAQVAHFSVKKLGLSARAANCLRRAHIESIGDLLQKSDYDLLRIQNLGVGTLKEIRSKLDWFCGIKP